MSKPVIPDDVLTQHTIVLGKTGSGKSTILAFMQNMWVRDPERVRALIERHGDDYRRRLIAYALFAGCLSGRRLKAAFGDLCGRIEWEEASPTITGRASECPAADPAHIRAALKYYKPDIVIGFGRIAIDALVPLWPGPFVRAPHPAARHKSVSDELLASAAQVRSLIVGPRQAIKAIEELFG